MFLSSIIPLTALNNSRSEDNHFLGREAHALFLDLVRRADPAISESIHEPRGDKPFTVSGLLEPRDRRALTPQVRVGLQYAWRVTAFEPRLSQLLGESVLPNLPREVRLGNTLFSTGKPITDPAIHNWAGITDANMLRSKWFDSEQYADRRIGFEFGTPTAHRQIHRNVLFPQPPQLWGGWLRAWNTYAHPVFEEDLIAQIEANVAISRYTLWTEQVDFGEYREAGWVGQATFTCFNDERAMWRVLNLLADFALYCGTGYKTTQGMGMTRRVPSNLRRDRSNAVNRK